MLSLHQAYLLGNEQAPSTRMKSKELFCDDPNRVRDPAFLVEKGRVGRRSASVDIFLVNVSCPQCGAWHERLLPAGRDPAVNPSRCAACRYQGWSGFIHVPLWLIYFVVAAVI